MKKLIGLFLLVASVGLLSGKADAASVGRSARGSIAVNYTTTVSTISTSGCSLYQVVLATGASAEYVALFDASAAGTKVFGTADSSLKTRLYFGSTTANTTVTFDPPLYFKNGLMVGDSAATGASLYIFEPGKATGY